METRRRKDVGLSGNGGQFVSKRFVEPNAGYDALLFDLEDDEATTELVLPPHCGALTDIRNETLFDAAGEDEPEFTRTRTEIYSDGARRVREILRAHGAPEHGPHHGFVRPAA